MASLFRRFVDWFTAGYVPSGTQFEAPPRPTEPRDVHESNMSWFFPPHTVSDSAAWDNYWQVFLSKLRLAANLLDALQFAGNGELAAAMAEAGFRRVLCVGNGVSKEPRALADAGFDVDALDLSGWASRQAEQSGYGPEDFLRFCRPDAYRSGGRVTYFTGDILDPSTCPGPYDCIIERKLLQLFPEDLKPTALAALAARLAPCGVLFSHAHNGGWRPSEPRTHPVEAALRAAHWTIVEGTGGKETRTEKTVWLFFSTG